MHVDSLVVCIVGKISKHETCRDGVKVLLSFPSCLASVFEASISTSDCFSSETFFVTCSLLFLGMVSKKKGGKGEVRR